MQLLVKTAFQTLVRCNSPPTTRTQMKKRAPHVPVRIQMRIRTGTRRTQLPTHVNAAERPPQHTNIRQTASTSNCTPYSLIPPPPSPYQGGGVTWSNDLHVGHMNEVTSSPPLARFELLPGRTTIRLPVILLRWNVLSLRGGHRFLSQAYQTHGPSNAKTDTMNH